LPHAVQKSKNEKRQKDTDDCVKQAFFSEDHVSNVPLKAVSAPLPFFANCNSAPWRVPMIHAAPIEFAAKTPCLATVKQKVAVPTFHRYTE
jgi:hypothetical protein